MCRLETTQRGKVPACLSDSCLIKSIQVQTISLRCDKDKAGCLCPRSTAGPGGTICSVQMPSGWRQLEFPAKHSSGELELNSCPRINSRLPGFPAHIMHG